MIDGWGISCEIALIWMSLNFTDDQSTLVQVIAWCHQATCHYLSQCWPRYLSPYCVTRPEWVDSFVHGRFEELNFRFSSLPSISIIDVWDISCEIILRWIPKNLTYDNSTLGQVMAWWRQPTGHYLSQSCQCWPRPMSPYGITRPQWLENKSFNYNLMKAWTKWSFCRQLLYFGLNFTGIYSLGSNLTISKHCFR